MEIITSLVTDKGVTRPSNQDSSAVLTAETTKGDVFFGIVCDGMGGYSDGEIASAEVVNSFVEWFKHQLPLVLFNSSDASRIISNVMKQWAYILGQCNSNLISYGIEKQIRLGTTCTCLLATEEWFCISHIGDTRIYCVHDGIEQILTEDHTYTAKEVNAGRLTPEEAKTHPKRHMLTRGLGMTSSVAAQMLSGKIEQGSVYVICSDGYRGTLETGQMAGYYGNGILDEYTMNEIAHTIIADNISRGERDNMTAVAVRFN